MPGSDSEGDGTGGHPRWANGPGQVILPCAFPCTAECTKWTGWSYPVAASPWPFFGVLQMQKSATHRIPMRVYQRCTERVNPRWLHRCHSAYSPGAQELVARYGFQKCIQVSFEITGPFLLRAS